MTPLLECRNLYKTYPGTTALRHISFAIPAGRIIGLLGPNGSGKTTLIKITSGILTPTSGEIFINGIAPGFETKSQVSYLPERTYFSDWMRVDSLIDFFADFYADFDRVKATEMLAHLDIDKRSRLKTLSKGTKEKVQLVLVMSRRAKLYLLDEPIGGVDPAARDYILRTILQNYSEESSVVISTHLIADIESVLDEVVFIQKGEIVLQSTVDEIREREQKTVDGLFREVFRC